MDTNGDWSCNACTLINDRASEVCSACLSVNTSKSTIATASLCNVPNDSVDEVSMTRNWSCHSCTYENFSESQNCAVCETPKETKPKENPEVVACGRCTYENRISARRCSACHNPLNTKHSQVSDLPTERNIPAQARDREAREHWEKMVSLCKMRKVSFVDEDFPPREVSLGDLREQREERNRGPLPEIVWVRPAQICTKEGRTCRWALFREPPRPTDIEQGFLGNCWLMSSLAVVAERPELLRRILVTQEYCHEGVYQIRLNLDGEWRIITLDDWFPCRVGGRGPQMVFSVGRRNQLWVPLIEKAVAKAFGGYGALVSGQSIEGLSILTGAPCESISLQKFSGSATDVEEAVNFAENLEDFDLIWVRLLSCKEAGFLMGASCGSSVDTDLERDIYNNLGLQHNHAYSLLDVKEVFGLRLVRLRNPWGRFSWKGEFGNESPLLTAELRKELMPHGVQEGVFWIPFEQFCKYFGRVDICKTRMGWLEERMSFRFPTRFKENSFKAVRLTVTENTELDLILYQENHRLKRERKHGHLDLCIIIVKEENKEFVACSSRKVTAFITLNRILQPGHYLVLTPSFNHWGMNIGEAESPHGVLAVHSARQLEAELIDVQGTVLADALIGMVLKNGTELDMGDGNLPNALGFFGQRLEVVYLQSKFAGLVMVAVNRNHLDTLNISCDCSGSMNVVSTRGAIGVQDTVPPQHAQILIVLSQLESTQGYSVNFHVASHQTPLGGVLGKIGITPRVDLNAHTPPLSESVLGLHVPRPLIPVKK